MTDAPKGPFALETELQALKANIISPSDDLLARVMADADTVQAEVQAPRQQTRQPFMARFLAVIGGWPSMAGLATAGLAGIWIGVSQPSALVQSSEVLIFGDGGAMVDLDPDFGFFDVDGDL